MHLHTHVNGVAEAPLRACCGHADPYHDVVLDVTVTGPGGRVWRVPGFWCGDCRWAFRFAPPAPGAYVWRTECSAKDDAGLHGVQGSITAIPYEGGNPLYRHGRVRVAGDGRHFAHADGAAFRWTGDTWWMGFTSRLDWPHGMRMLTQDRVRKGFTVVQIVAGPLPDMDAGDPRGANAHGFPFEPGFGRVNPAFFDLADIKVAHLADAGLMPCMVGMWGYYLPRIGREGVMRFWRYLIARYGAYPVAWCAAGEGTMPYYLSETPEADAEEQREGWTGVIRFMRETDPFGNMITIHPSQCGRDCVSDPAVLDFEMLQTGHGGFESVGPTARIVRESVNREPRMPVVEAEVNYEGILGGSHQDVQRATFLCAMLSGAAGYTYGANGLWQMSTEEQPYGASPHGRSWGSTPWRKAAALPGGRQLAAIARFLGRYPLWRCVPHPEWVGYEGDPDLPQAPRCVGIAGELRILYHFRMWDPPCLHGMEPGLVYRACYYDPIEDSILEIGEAAGNADGFWTGPVPPVCHDWLLVLDARKDS